MTLDGNLQALPPQPVPQPKHAHVTPPTGNKDRRIGFVFGSLIGGATLAKEFRGKVDLKDGVINVAGAWAIYLAINIVLFLILSLVNPVSFGALIPLAVGVILTAIFWIVLWLLISFAAHYLAQALGGRGDFKEYAALLSFPGAGFIVLYGLFGWIPLLEIVVFAVLALMLLISEVRITQEEYGIGGWKSLAVILIPTVVLGLIGLVVLGFVLAALALMLGVAMLASAIAA